MPRASHTTRPIREIRDRIVAVVIEWAQHDGDAERYAISSESGASDEDIPRLRRREDAAREEADQRERLPRDPVHDPTVAGQHRP